MSTSITPLMIRQASRRRACNCWTNKNDWNLAQDNYISLATSNNKEFVCDYN